MMARAIADALFEWDLATDRLWWGAGLSGRFGYPRECTEYGLEGWSQHIHPEDRERVIHGVRDLLEKENEAWSDEFRLLGQNGNTAFVLARGFVVRDLAHHALRLTGGMYDITSRRECEQRLDQSSRQLRAFSSRLQQLREEDRRKISRDLHDTLGQILTGLKMDLVWIEKNLSDNNAIHAPVLDKLLETEELIDVAISEVQRIATDFRPDVLDNLGLASAVQCEAEAFQQRSGMECRVDIAAGLPEPSPGVSIGLFRILQEALTNIVRHARANKVLVHLRQEGPVLRLDILDDGVGIDPAELIRPGALGLLGMREHANMLGGRLEIRLREPRGTQVSVSVPFQEPTISVWETLSSKS